MTTRQLKSEKTTLSENVEPLPDRTPVKSETSSSLTSKYAVIDRIRTELLEDNYHTKLVEPEYWDESHNWSDGDESVSDDYWHFLGRYE